MIVDQHLRGERLGFYLDSRALVKEQLIFWKQRGMKERCVSRGQCRKMGVLSLEMTKEENRDR